MQARTWPGVTAFHGAAGLPVGPCQSDRVSSTPTGSPEISRSLVGTDAPRQGTQIRVLICDDHPLYRMGLQALFADIADMVVTGVCFQLLDAWNDRLNTRPHLLLVGQQRSAGTVDLIRRFAAAGTAVIVLAAEPDESDVLDAVRAGARASLPREVPTQQLLDVIRAACRHHTVLHGDAARPAGHVRAQSGPVPAQPAAGSRHLFRHLTARQREVARLVAAGLSNTEVATELFVSQATVKSHLTIILKRLNLRDRTQLAILVNRNMQIDPHPPAWNT